MHRHRKTILKDFASVETFESTDLGTFRFNLKECLRKTPIENDDEAYTAGIPWKKLCKAHDSLGNERNHSSPLEEVCHSMCNPTVIPSANAGCIFMCLLRLILIKPEKCQWRSSELLLLDCMTTLVKRVSALSILSNLEVYQEKTMHLNSIDEIVSKKLDANLYLYRLHKYVSILSELSQRSNDLWFRCTCLHLFLHMARKLDDADIQLLQKPHRVAQEDGTMCLHCQKRIVPLTMPRVRRQGVSMLRLLDDEGVVEDPRKTPAGSVATGDSCRCTHASRQPLSQASVFTQLPFKFVTLRSRAYEKILETLSSVRLNPKTHSTFIRKIGLYVGPANVLERTLALACQYPQVPSLRLSLMLVTDAIGPKGFDFVLRRLWGRFDNGGAEHILRIWSELITESSNFDEVRRCWSGMEPLFTRILSYCALHDDEDAVVALDTKIYHLLRSLSTVLSRRRPALKSNDAVLKSQFQDFVTRVSVSFGELSYWITTDMEEMEVENIISTLQNVGILGLQCSEDRGTEHGCSNWPFANRNGVRGAHCRMGPRVSRNQLLLSEPEDVNELQRLLAEPKNTEPNKRRHGDSKASAPILNYLNDDIFRTVLSFLNHVDLVRVGGLSRVCRSLAHEEMQWKHVFHSKYGIIGDKDDIEKTISKIGSWRNLFCEKYYSEKALKFKYSATGWKHRTCNYVGCYQVVRSLEKQIKHHQVHELRSTKKQDRQEETRKRKLEKDTRQEEIRKRKDAQKKDRQEKTRKRKLEKDAQKKERQEETRKRKADAKKEAPNKRRRKSSPDVETQVVDV